MLKSRAMVPSWSASASRIRQAQLDSATTPRIRANRPTRDSSGSEDSRSTQFLARACWTLASASLTKDCKAPEGLGFSV